MQGPEHLPAYKPGGRLETFDIEELVAEGKAGYAHAATLGPVRTAGCIRMLKTDCFGGTRCLAHT